MKSRKFQKGSFAGRSRAFFLVCLAAILYAIANTSGSGWLYVISAGIFGTVLISAASLPFTVRGLEISRRTSRVGTAGEPLSCTVKIRNGNRLPRYLLETEDDFAGGVGSGAIARIGAGETVEIGYEIPHPRRGVYPDGDITVFSSAPFGLIRARRRVSIASETEIRPLTFSVADLPPPSRMETIGETSDSPATQRGLGGDFWGIREYRPGDPARLIAWRGSARSLASGKLSVMEFSDQTSPPLTVALDLDPLAPEDAREMIVSAAASIMLQSLREERGVYADAGPQRVPFPENLDSEAVLSWCARLEASAPSIANEPSVRITPTLRKLAGHELRGETVVLVSCRDFAGDGAWMTAGEERTLLSRIESEGRRAVLLGRNVSEPWRLS